MASNMESEMDEVGKVNNALPDNLDDLFSIDDNEEDEDYEEAEEDPFDLLNNISENNALTESPFRLKAPSKTSKKAQSESPDKGGFSFGSSVPQFEQSSFGALSSVLGKSKKKKQPSSQFIPVNLNNKKLLKKNVTDHFSLSHALDALTVDSTQYVNSLSLSCVEQVTDMFFLMIKIQRVPLHRLTSFSLTGNAFVSDEGINWLLKTSGFKAQEISFKGCINLTHKSLYAILNMAIKPTKIDLSFTGVSTVQTMPSTMTSLTLDCCPLISPPAAMMNTRELRDVMSDKTLIPFETYKLLVLHDPSDANGTGLFVKKTLDKSHPFCVEKAWHPESSNSPQYNVYECLTGSVSLKLIC
ncbi:uncharacterized protein [Argopecten irradians]|uniref:uncharacterized protein n=1 Tax=Argopecten irradians TaxID=31199 RepID=UPI00371E5907